MELHNKIWWTRKSRIQAEIRLRSNEMQAQMILLWYAFFSVAVSIYYLVAKSLSPAAPGVWVILSVFSLVASGFISGLNYRSRANLVKECYERLEMVRQEAIAAGADTAAAQVVADKYIKILGLCENHADIDYHSARCKMDLSGDTGFTPGISNYDYAYWLGYKFIRLVLFTMIYISPIVLLYVLEFKNVSGNCV